MIDVERTKTVLEQGVESLVNIAKRETKEMDLIDIRAMAMQLVHDGLILTALVNKEIGRSELQEVKK